jgi:hypothetical protein
MLLMWLYHRCCWCGFPTDVVDHNLNIGSTSVKEQAYKSLVRPSLEYACSVWDPHLKSDINKIETDQWRDARYVTNRQRNTSSVGDILNGAASKIDIEMHALSMWLYHRCCWCGFPTDVVDVALPQMLLMWLYHRCCWCGFTTSTTSVGLW